MTEFIGGFIVGAVIGACGAFIALAVFVASGGL